MTMTNKERLKLILDLAMKPNPNSSGCSGNIGLGFYESDGHYVVFHRGDKRAVVHAKNKDELMKQLSVLVDQLTLTEA